MYQSASNAEFAFEFIVICGAALTPETTTMEV